MLSHASRAKRRDALTQATPSGSVILPLDRSSTGWTSTAGSSRALMPSLRSQRVSHYPGVKGHRRHAPETNCPFKNVLTPPITRTTSHGANVSACSSRFHSGCAAP
jgi:hypothetical protein